VRLPYFAETGQVVSGKCYVAEYIEAEFASRKENLQREGVT
jgi:hypothetical protein